MRCKYLYLATLSWKATDREESTEFYCSVRFNEIPYSQCSFSGTPKLIKATTKLVVNDNNMREFKKKYGFSFLHDMFV